MNTRHRPARQYQVPETPRFVVDAMLGNVARDLRLLGYDAAFAGRRSDSEILRLCQAQNRVLVTRDQALARRAGSLPCVLLAENCPANQTVEVLAALSLDPPPERTYARCLACNAQLEPVPRGRAFERVPDHVALTHRTFKGCPGCGRTYWEGSHGVRLDEKVRRIVRSLHRQGARV